MKTNQNCEEYRVLEYKELMAGNQCQLLLCQSEDKSIYFCILDGKLFP